MNVVIPFHTGDQDQAERLIRWIAELGKQDSTVFLMSSQECNYRDMNSLAANSFRAVEHIFDYENVKSDWQGADRSKPRSAAGPNSLFRQTAWHMFHYNLRLKQSEPWLWLEPDAIPTRPDWLIEIEAEYKTGRKPFMGAFVSGNVPTGNMSGVAVYPHDAAGLMEGAMMASNLPFDIAKPGDVVPKAHFTNRIIHQFQAPPFLTRADFNTRIPEGTLLFHSCKDGSVLPFLRERLFGKKNDALPVSAEPSPVKSSDSAEEWSVSIPADTLTEGDTFTINGHTFKYAVTAESIPKSRTEQVRALANALNSLADTPAHRAKVLHELKRVKLIPSKLRRR